MPALSRRKWRADQDMIEAECGGMLQLRGPCVKRPDEKGMNEVDPRRIGLTSFHRSVPVSAGDGDVRAARDPIAEQNGA
jgi:hypothetical protein